MSLFSARSERVLFVDLARAAAVLFMIQGHTLSVLLAPGYEQNLLFGIWLLLRGCTSSAFLLLSGFSFALATDKYRADYITWTPRLRRRLARFSVFLALGYAMRIPVRPLSRLRHLTPDQLHAFGAVDILQLVAVCLFVLQAFAWFSRSRERFATAAAVTAALTVLLSPPVGSVDWQAFLPVFLASYMTSATGSLFPVFPWAAYLFLGAALGTWFLHLREMRGAGHAAKSFAILGGAMVATGLLLHQVPVTLYPQVEFWRNSPNLFLIKTGSILVFLSAAIVLTRHLKALPRPITVLSRESLTIYFVHLCVLYGSIWNQGLYQRVGPRLGLSGTVTWILVMLITMSLLAWMWHEFKQRWTNASALFRVALTVGALYAIA